MVSKSPLRWNRFRPCTILPFHGSPSRQQAQESPFLWKWASFSLSQQRLTLPATRSQRIQERHQAPDIFTIQIEKSPLSKLGFSIVSPNRCRKIGGAAIVQQAAAGAQAPQGSCA